MNPVDIVMRALADRYGWEDYDIESDLESIRPDAVVVVAALKHADLLAFAAPGYALHGGRHLETE
jgi:hypothetical protein